MQAQIDADTAALTSLQQQLTAVQQRQATDAAALTAAVQQQQATDAAALTAAVEQQRLMDFFNPQDQSLRVVDTAFCLDVPDGNKSWIYPLQSNSCTGTPSQLWKYTNSNLVNKNSGLCLDIKANGKAAGTQVGQYPCQGGQNQKWVYNISEKTLTSPSAPGMCLDLSGGVAGKGSTLSIETCNGRATQKWTL